MTNLIRVSLERPVPYDIYLTPLAPGFIFDPPVLEFLSYLGTKQYFKIRPLDNARIGQNKITWVKNETDIPRFSEIADTYFNLVDRPSYNELKILLLT